MTPRHRPAAARRHRPVRDATRSEGSSPGAERGGSGRPTATLSLPPPFLRTSVTTARSSRRKAFFPTRDWRPRARARTPASRARRRGSQRTRPAARTAPYLAAAPPRRPRPTRSVRLRGLPRPPGRTRSRPLPPDQLSRASRRPRAPAQSRVTVTALPKLPDCWRREAGSRGAGGPAQPRRGGIGRPADDVSGAPGAPCRGGTGLVCLEVSSSGRAGAPECRKLCDASAANKWKGPGSAAMLRSPAGSDGPPPPLGAGFPRPLGLVPRG